MESKIISSNQVSILFLWATLAALLVPALSQLNFQDQKNFFFSPHDPTTPPTVSYSPPHTTPTVPSHGGSPPAANCGKPPSNGGHHSTPTHSPSPPKSGGGYYHSPPTKTPSPSTKTPSHDPPKTVTPPTTLPSPPSTFDPHSPPFTCTYWKNHPTLIWTLFGYWGSIGSAFGMSSSLSASGFGPHMNLLQALSNTRLDGYGELYREGTAAFLNSISHSDSFPYTTAQVKLGFAGALSSNSAAASQAHIFQMANEGKTKKPTA